jgi:hypothetical protein
MLKEYQGKQVAWGQYADRYLALIGERHVATQLDRATFEGPSVLLCSEPTPERCHRRLVAEYLSQAWGGLEVAHL